MEGKALTPERLREIGAVIALAAQGLGYSAPSLGRDFCVWAEQLERERAVIKQLVDALRRCWHAENCNTNRLRSTEPDAQVCNCGRGAVLAAAEALEGGK